MVVSRDERGDCHVSHAKNLHEMVVDTYCFLAENYEQMGYMVLTDNFQRAMITIISEGRYYRLGKMICHVRYVNDRIANSII